MFRFLFFITSFLFVTASGVGLFFYFNQEINITSIKGLSSFVISSVENAAKLMPPEQSVRLLTLLDSKVPHCMVRAFPDILRDSNYVRAPSGTMLFLESVSAIEGAKSLGGNPYPQMICYSTSGNRFFVDANADAQFELLPQVDAPIFVRLSRGCLGMTTSARIFNDNPKDTSISVTVDSPGGKMHLLSNNQGALNLCAGTNPHTITIYRGAFNGLIEKEIHSKNRFTQNVMVNSTSASFALANENQIIASPRAYLTISPDEIARVGEPNQPDKIKPNMETKP